MVIGGRIGSRPWLEESPLPPQSRCLCPSGQRRCDFPVHPAHAQQRYVEVRTGFEPAYNGFANRCLTTWLPHHEIFRGRGFAPSRTRCQVFFIVSCTTEKFSDTMPPQHDRHDGQMSTLGAVFRRFPGWFSLHRPRARHHGHATPSHATRSF